ncbi:MAG: ferrous iron transport protein B [Verrucomicrobia bacterium]|nr:ferrous iron transport protein B [Verrucomicrobiota bacterium]
MKNAASSNLACKSCPRRAGGKLQRFGLDLEKWDYVVALAGNPNTGKSTVFNALTGLRQHTGNWPGKTVTRAEGSFAYGGSRYKLVDLPGAYSLLAASPDEETARNFLLFGKPDATVVVVDATRLERNLNLVLQILEIADRVVVCVNLIDEAERQGLRIDARQLARDLGVPVVLTAARSGRGLEELLQAIEGVAGGKTVCRPKRALPLPEPVRRAVGALVPKLRALYPELPNAAWVALRLLDGDDRVMRAVRSGVFDATEGESVASPPTASPEAEEILRLAEAARADLGAELHDQVAQALFERAGEIAARTVIRPQDKPPYSLEQKIDRMVTSPVWGLPIMLLLFALVFWLTIVGTNYPSALLSDLLVDRGPSWLHGLAGAAGLPQWLQGLLIDGAYLTTAWVVSVMLPPMAIFFPLFTALEDLGYLPRVAFNLDGLFQKAGAHGKQALTMMMGFGCNAAGVISTRIIDSPRERLIAMITNNFALCNGRWPTQIILASLFIGALVPSWAAGLVSAAAVVGVALLGVALSFVVSWGLSRTLLRGEPSAFTLELPPYRPPRLLPILYRSLIERTIFVLWRAMVFAVPAGLAVWIISNVHVGSVTLAEKLVSWLDPIGFLIGLNGVVLLAYIVAIPANEIILPTVLMLTVLANHMTGVGAGAGVLFEQEGGQLKSILEAGGWTVLTAVNVMLFSLIHNPCSTTIYTIYKESGSARWAAIATLLPLGMGFVATFFVAQLWRLLAGW